ncbi:MAG: sigma-70 family RNA polymerase sigma factor [Planctomycetes bacterium]|nr:sigma-70 family RNA polymerase sigma factor [Planctomycetota bacterium]
MRDFSRNPLEGNDPQAWAALVEAVGLASLLVVIEVRMGPELMARVGAEDILQETLLHAWRDRTQCDWTGVAGFRRWLLGILDNRIRDARDYFAAAKRASDREQPLVQTGSERGSCWEHEPWRSTTPSRMALHREQAEQMARALASVPDELRDVLRLRLFEGLTMEECANQLGIGLSAAKHRYRKGAALYRADLFRRLGSRTEEKA